MQNNETKFNNIEITIEVNPGTITNSKIKDYKKSGINRISIGLQSTNNNLLKEIGRIHTFEEFLEAYNIVKKAFDNINIDLMIGLPKQKILDIKKSLEEIIKLNPNHVSVYSLILEEGTVLYKKVENNDLELPSEDEERKMYWYVKNTLELNGYKHYEISNFAKKEKESKHNMNCWEQTMLKKAMNQNTIQTVGSKKNTLELELLHILILKIKDIQMLKAWKNI